MRRIALLTVSLILLAVASAAQNSPTIYAESFRKGSTTIVEDSFDVKLTPSDSSYKERIKDSKGNNRYELTITPQILEGDNKITAWRVTLRDLHHTIYPNTLLADQQPSDDPKNNLWWLNPNPYGPVPIRTKRIVKVDGFYAAFQVKDLHFTPLDSPYLDSMTVSFAFSNTDPRANH
jgi:hypothetical protein